MLFCAIVSAKRGGLEIHKNEGTGIRELVSEESERQIERKYLGVQSWLAGLGPPERHKGCCTRVFGRAKQHQQMT